MNRKPKPDSYVQPMPKGQFIKLMHEFKAIGGKYICNKESEEFLEAQEAEASALDGYTILFRRKPTRSAVYEELFHTSQYREGKIDGTLKNRIKCEIEAQEYLLKNAEAFQLTEPEIIQTQKALHMYQLELSNWKGGSYDNL